MSQMTSPETLPEATTKLCPWCDKPLDGPTVNGLHQHCANEYNEEQDRYEAWRLGAVGNVDHVTD